MTHSKTFKRDDGSRVEITVWLRTGSMGSEPPAEWKFQLRICKPNKRKFHSPNDQDSYSYRNLTMREREQHNILEYLKHATPAEILQTKMELWNKIKPE